MYLYIHKYSIHVYRPRRMAFEAGRGTGRTPRDSEGTRRTALPDPRGLPTDAGRNWRRTLQDLEGRPVLPGLLLAAGVLGIPSGLQAASRGFLNASRAR